jgi:hypothetical protein
VMSAGAVDSVHASGAVRTVGANPRPRAGMGVAPAALIALLVGAAALAVRAAR